MAINAPATVLRTSPDVWPDWTGQAVAIVASGPSTKTAGVELLKDRIATLAIKRNIDLCPWAEAVYGCDFPWWRSVEGLPDYQGHRLAWDARARDQYGCRKVDIPKIREDGDTLLTGQTGVVGGGGNSGFQALNLAVQFGATRILLIGFDMHDRGGVHWYGRNTGYQMNNPSADNFRRWVAAFTKAAPVLADLGVEVVNAAAQSALTCFRRQGVKETLDAWGL